MVKQKLRMNDLGSPDTRPSFYKIIWLANSINLRIPPAFKHHLLSKQTDRATLRSPCGTWDVELQPKEGDIYFARGWQEFVRHHFLGKAEWLIFKYNGDISFDVVIYDGNGCERKYRLGGTSRQQSRLSSFTSLFPFFEHSIKATNVGSKSTLIIPQVFARKHLPPSRHRLILRNSKGFSWSVSVIAASVKNLAISGGWKAFTDDNSVKKGDVCIFELVEQDTMQVHIFR